MQSTATLEYEKWRPGFAEKQVEDHSLDITPQKRSGKVARQLFGHVWEKSGKILCAPKNLLTPSPMARHVSKLKYRRKH